MGIYAAQEGPKERRVFGPPGTGKTTFIKTQVQHDSESYAPDEMMLVSYTNVAVWEIRNRLQKEGLDVPKENVGTLHSMAYRSIGKPPVTESFLDEWNKWCPMYALGGGEIEDAGFRGKREGDTLQQEYDRCRGNMIPRERWAPQVLRFASRWEGWKRETGYVDFNDMIEGALQEAPYAPMAPAVSFFDEAQDFTPLELRLVRKWTQEMDRVYVVGDDDQTLYQFRGASPDAFLNPPLGPEYKKVLSQSWRVPRTVLELSQRWVRQLQVREPKDYEPRAYEGYVKPLGVGWKNPDQALRLLDTLLDQGKTVMFLTTCGYMLNPLLRMLKDNGYPFHNPYARGNGRWNPLTPAHSSTVSAVDRLCAYTRPETKYWGADARMWTWHDVRLWADLLSRREMMHKGAGPKLDALAEDHADEEATYDVLLALFPEQVLDAASRHDLPWLYRNMLASKRERFEYPYKVIDKRGFKALTEKPRVIPSTIHGVKGGEASVVILWPDLSRQGADAWHSRGERHDAIIRQFYVAMTRAREGLYIGAPSGRFSVSLAV